MCGHYNKIKINGAIVCPNCGLTVMADGRVMFDKKIIKYKNTKKEKKRR